jgi:uncharacterized SAM-binding protein YcdF (DUF218 family)
MYLLKKLITAFILPPGIFILVMVFAGTFLLAFKRRLTGIFLIFLGLFMWGLSITPVTDLLLADLVRGIQPGNDQPRGDVVILLGGGVDDRLIDLSGERGILNESMVDRLVTAARLVNRLQVPIIVSGGRAAGGRVAEADAARRYLLDLGVSAEAVVTESASTVTFENAENVKKICLRYGYTRPILVTSAYHLKRALWSFERAGLHCTPFANGLASLPAKEYRWKHYLPGSFDAAALYLHEYIGMLYYRLVY